MSKPKKRPKKTWHTESALRRERKVQEKWAEWLDEHEWDHWITLTFKSRVGGETAARSVQEWIRHLDRAAQQPVRYFAVKEVGTIGGRTHYHLLICGTKALKRRVIAKSWRHGVSKVDKYDRSGGAAHYVAKDLSLPGSEFMMSPRLSRRDQ